MRYLYRQKLTKRARALRKNGTRAEALLWSQLKSRQCGGMRFIRQKPIGDYIVDFYCHAKKLVLEIDGDTHEGKKIYDMRRQRNLENRGLRVVRFADAEIKRNIDNVLLRIQQSE